MSEQSFEFDVAFSFLAQDEGLATRLNDLLQGRVRTFIYSERQKELAGKDGEQVFGSVFGEKSRFVALLYRAGWGETPWTRVEKIAIQNRTLQEGHDFLLCIPLDQPPTPPKWIPRNRIWIGLDRWGVDGAASVIEARVQELGGEPAEETPALRAARLGRKREFERLREQFIEGSEGIDKANEAVTHLKMAVGKLAEEIAASEQTLPLKVAEVRGEFVLIGLGPAMVMNWQQRWSNTLKESALWIEFCNRLPAHLARIPERHRTLEKTKFCFDWVEPGQPAWVANEWPRKTFTSDELASELLKRYMDFAESHKST
jgi:hypothetical protein